MAIINIKTEITGNIWKIEAKVGQTLAEGDTIMILESMKMEIPLVAMEPGCVVSILVAEGDVVKEGQDVLLVECD